jgi:GNAT superfamily N-acetyltransferase
VRVRAPSWPDLPDVLELVTVSDVAAIGESDVTADVLASDWRQLDLEHDAWVIELDGRIAAYATFDDRGGGRMIADGYVHPRLRGKGLGAKLIEVTEAHARGRIASQPADARVFLQQASLLGDDCTPNLFARHGYEPAQYQFRMLAELSAPPEVPSVAGVEIRLLRDPD